MTAEFATLHKILKDQTRQTILKCLKDKGPLPYVELMKLGQIENTGRANYHLKALSALVEKQSDGRYGLTEKGRLALDLLDNFSENGVHKGRRKNTWKKVAAIIAVVCIVIAPVSVYWYNAQLTAENAAKPVAIPYSGALMDITGSNNSDWKSEPHTYYVSVNFNNTGFLYNAEINVQYLAMNGSWITVSTTMPSPVSRGTGTGVFTQNYQYVPGTKCATPLYFQPGDDLSVIKVEVHGYRNP